VTRHLRAFLDAQGFIDVETPMLTKTTPEGARDYLVPSRVHQGHFYALPQSPQLFKQILMMGGLDRYYQIVRCFRDEDPARRPPARVHPARHRDLVHGRAGDHLTLMEEMIRGLFREVLGVALPDPFPRMTYAEAVARFGIDGRTAIPMELTEVSDLLREVEFKVFAAPANAADGRVAALRVPGGGRLSRKEIDTYTELVGRYGAKGLAYIKINSTSAGLAGLQSPILKFLPEPVVEEILRRTGAQGRRSDLLRRRSGPHRQ